MCSTTTPRTAASVSKRSPVSGAWVGSSRWPRESMGANGRRAAGQKGPGRASGGGAGVAGGASAPTGPRGAGGRAEVGDEMSGDDAVVRRRVVVRGLVQGVGFRASVAREAGRAGLAGFARNQGDGSVLVELEGRA